MMKRFIYLLCLMAIPFAGNAQRWSKSLEKSAKKGDVTAQLEVANAYFKGNGVEKDLEKAAKWYYEAILQGEDAAKENFYSFYSKQLEKFAKSGDAQAQYEVGCDYLKGSGVDKDVKTAAEWFLLAVQQNHEQAIAKFYSFYSKQLEKMAKEGDARAQFETGNCYYMGREVDKDTEEASEWYQKAMAQGHEEATEKFYSFYSKALEKAAKNGDARAQFETGNAYLNGSGIKRDTETASEWFMQAMAQNHAEATEMFYSFYSKSLEKRAKGGDARAQFETGNGYYNGNIVSKDNNTAAKWYKMAMAQGHEEATEKFYSFYSKELEKAAKENDARAQYETGNAYLSGSGIERDPEEASEWYMKAMAQNHAEATEKFYSFYSKALEKAAKKGDARAQFETGNAYLTGTTGKKDTETAAEWFMKAMSQGHEEATEKFYSTYSKELEKRAKSGDARAQFETGNSYYTGNVVTKNDNTAAEWYMKAMLQGHEAATEKFYSFYSKDLEKRAKGGDARAQFETGNYYFTGLGVKTDHETAAEWYEMAMKQGHEDAKTKFYAFYSKILEKAAKNGDAEAQFQVGNFYFTGATGKKDIETAAEWYEKGMSQGHEGAKEKYYSYYSKTLEKNSKKDIEALYRIGCFYMDGGSVEKDMKKAIKLLLKADKDGHPEAFNKFGSVFNKELQKMAKKGDVRAKLAIAKCYLNGSGITKNPKRAAEFLEEIADDFEVGEEAKALLQSIENE